VRFFATLDGRCELKAVSQEEKQTIPVSVVALRAESYSADGDNIVISLRTKYSTAERKYSVPVECFQDLIVDLQRLSASRQSESADKANDQTEPLLPLEMPVAAE
jgi:hypothetical protein